MTFTNPIPVHETAFMISSFRAANQDLSKDPYAYLWKNATTDKWIKSYLKEVSIDEKWSHCLRNRYFTDTIESLFKEGKIDVLINFGAGFSMYPYILPEGIVNIEIDKPQVLEFKKQSIAKWQQEGKVPFREVYSISVDFDSDYKISLHEKLTELIGDSRVFILLEGVLFFLNSKITNELFGFFNTLLKPGDYLGSVSFQDTLRETQAFKNLNTFFEAHFTEDINPYQTINDRFYWELPNYQLLDRQDYFSLSLQYNHTPELERDFILNENFYILKKE